ncbi:IS4 family transposase [Spartinivicinus poritis]|uniref:IS4 family transposase n=1 Tax=Spartinivicinus poritis TaxID=2994640 RepID=A0ABT5UJG9_9GAMM|nr:IS4 family transposase [Spartinivicinus sp. A2-2]MDE1466096.1 IS4 family transposase [Spartinivicinus sp. A2-2]
MSISPILQRFMEQSPIPVMAQALLERVLSPEWLNDCFARVSDKQYTRDLLFSSLFDLMSLTVTNVFPTVSNAYKANKIDIGVSLTSVYNKLNGLEPGVMEALVEETSLEFDRIIKGLHCEAVKSWLPGYSIRIVDGNCIEATHRRLQVLRQSDGAPLPGKTIVLYSPETGLITDIVPCEDGHAQERSLLTHVRQKVKRNQVYVMDSNFCVLSHLKGIADQEGFFVCRVHQRFSYSILSEPVSRGETESGDLYEQQVILQGKDNKQIKCRLISLHLYKPTRNGATKLLLITNLAGSDARAEFIAYLYQKRWSIETMFQHVESYFHSEINTLGYPRAALFGFSIAIIAYNVLSVIKSALESVYGEEKVENEVSGYYIAGEIGRTYEGMNIAISKED